MKLFYNQPTKQLRIVKPDRDAAEYEFWVLVPVKVGGARKVSSNRVITDDGQHMVNLATACQHYLESNHSELMGELTTWRSSSKAVKLAVTGMDMMAQGKWPEFCKQRGLNLKSVEALQATYELTKQEATALGVSHDQAGDL